MMILTIIIILLLVVAIAFYIFIRNSYVKKNKQLNGFMKFYYNVVQAIKEPYKVLLKEKHRLSVFLWFLFTIFAAQIGTMVNLIKHVIFTEPTSANQDWWVLVQESLYMDSHSGSFYTFSIVLTASVLSPLFIKFIENGVHFKKLKVLTIVLSIFTLFFGGIFYSFSTIDNRDYSSLANTQFSIDRWQLAFFIIAIVIALYSYGLSRMDLDAESYPDLDDYNYPEKERERVNQMAQTEAEHNEEEEEGVQV